MAQVNQDLISTRIKKTSKQKLELIKAIYAAHDSPLSKSDYAILEHLIDQEHERTLVTIACHLAIIKNQVA